MGRDHGTAQVEGTLDRRVQFDYKLVEFFSGHRVGYKDVGSREGDHKDVPLCPISGACGGNQFKPGVKVIKNRVVVGAIKASVNPPEGDRGGESTGKGDINAGMLDCGLKGRGVVRILNS